MPESFPDPESFLRSCFRALCSGDKDGFDTLSIAKSEFIAAVNARLPRERRIKNRGNIPEQEASLFDKVIVEAMKLGIGLSNSSLIDCSYTISKHPAFMFTSFYGGLYFKHGENIYQIGQCHGILLNNNWRVLAIGLITQLENYPPATKFYMISNGDMTDITEEVVSFDFEEFEEDQRGKLQ